MDRNELLIALVSSGIIAALISSIVTILFKQIDYKREYYRIIINKRLDAYEALEICLAFLEEAIMTEAGKYYTFLESWEEFSDFDQKVRVAFRKGRWISLKTITKLSEMQQYIYPLIETKLKKDLSKYEVMDKDLRIEASKVLSTYRNELNELVRVDMLNLYKIKRF